MAVAWGIIGPPLAVVCARPHGLSYAGLKLSLTLPAAYSLTAGDEARRAAQILAL
jgi:hypothetical protein